MDIALVLELLAPDGGGAERYAWRLAGYLIAAGHRVRYICRAVARHPGPGPLEIVCLGDGPGPRTTRALRFERAVAAELRRHAPDVSLALMRVCGTDLVMPHGGVHADTLALSLDSSRSALARLGRRLARACSPRQRVYLEQERRLYSQPRLKGVLAVSELVAGHLRARFPEVADRLVVVPNGIDTERWRPAESAARAAARRALGLSADGLLAVFAAHRFALKGLATALEALARVRGWGLLVAGGDRRERFERRARRLGLAGRVHFLGARADMETVYHAADAAVLPTAYDPCPLSTLEAWACGLPVITTRRNGALDPAPPPTPLGAAQLIDGPGDADGLATALLAWSAPEVRAQAAAAARQAALARPEAAAFARVLALLKEGIAAPSSEAVQARVGDVVELGGHPDTG